MQIDLSGFIPDKFVLGLKTKGRLIIVTKEFLQMLWTGQLALQD